MDVCFLKVVALRQFGGDCLVSASYPAAKIEGAGDYYARPALLVCDAMSLLRSTNRR